ncbi:MAG: AAA family ATPase [Candidatus Aminicenantes bacterium]|nr:AAA family ATPase [Candidatus Aminicenantes bacterium]
MSETEASEKYEEEVFITDLAIHRVRHLKDIHIPLSKDERKHLILTGKNGSGKTSVLNSIKTEIWSILSLPGGLVWADDKEGKKRQGVSFEFSGNRKYIDYFRDSHFVFSFYSARRQVDMTTPTGLNKIDLKRRFNIDEYPGKEFIQYIVNLKAEKSFARDDKDYETAQNIDLWFENFEDGLKEIFEDLSLRLDFDRKNYNFNIIQENKEPFDFNTLADGYSAIINVVADIILRMGQNKTISYDVQGLILIDEIDAHLHINLQKKIFPFLTRFFPRIQFIVTTHSPFVLNSIENAVIYDLEKKLLVNDLSGYAYDGIVEGYFENDKYSEIIKNKIAQYEQLVNREKRTETEEDQMIDLKKYLESIPGSLAPELKAKFQQVELYRIGKQHD